MNKFQFVVVPLFLIYHLHDGGYGSRVGAIQTPTDEEDDWVDWLDQCTAHTDKELCLLEPNKEGESCYWCHESGTQGSCVSSQDACLEECVHVKSFPRPGSSTRPRCISHKLPVTIKTVGEEVDAATLILDPSLKYPISDGMAVVAHVQKPFSAYEKPGIAVMLKIIQRQHIEQNEMEKEQIAYSALRPGVRNHYPSPFGQFMGAFQCPCLDGMRLETYDSHRCTCFVIDSVVAGDPEATSLSALIEQSDKAKLSEELLQVLITTLTNGANELIQNGRMLSSVHSDGVLISGGDILVVDFTTEELCEGSSPPVLDVEVIHGIVATSRCAHEQETAGSEDVPEAIVELLKSEFRLPSLQRCRTGRNSVLLCEEDSIRPYYEKESAHGHIVKIYVGSKRIYEAKKEFILTKAFSRNERLRAHISTIEKMIQVDEHYIALLQRYAGETLEEILETEVKKMTGSDCLKGMKATIVRTIISQIAEALMLAASTKNDTDHCGKTMFESRVMSSVDVGASASKPIEYPHGCRSHSHNDIKPSNVAISNWDPVKVVVLDWGSAQPCNVDSSEVPSGTVSYLAPERLNKDATRNSSLCISSDVFSLGALYVEMTTGIRVFSGDLAARSTLKDEGVRTETKELLRKCTMLEEDERRFILQMIHLDPTHRPNLSQVYDMVAAFGGNREPGHPS